MGALPQGWDVVVQVVVTTAVMEVNGLTKATRVYRPDAVFGDGPVVCISVTGIR